MAEELEREIGIGKVALELLRPGGTVLDCTRQLTHELTLQHHIAERQDEGQDVVPVEIKLAYKNHVIIIVHSHPFAV